MKPLASPVTEYRLMGVIEIVGGVVLAAAAVVVADRPGVAAVSVLVMAALFGTWMYLLAYRRFARRAVDEPGRAPTEEREAAGRTTARIVLATGALLVFLALVGTVATTLTVVAGVALGNGAALWMVARWLGRWEERSGRRLLREPRWRWSRRGRRGWGRGRGIMDPQDFYVAS